MHFTLLKSSFHLVLLVCAVAVFAAPAGAVTLNYTVQTGCEETMSSALKRYYELVNSLDRNDLDFLRIEEIGRSYCVRIGKFRERARAMKFHRSIKPRIASSEVLPAYVLDERVKMMFFHTPPAEDAHAEGLPPSGSQSGKKKRTAAGVGQKPASDHESRGDTHIEEKRLLSAAEEYRRAIADDPDNAELIWKLAVLYHELQLSDDAFKFMQRAIGLSPGRAVPWRTKLGMLYYENGRLNEAAEQFEIVLDMDPEAAGINYYLGRIYLAGGRPDNAREHFIQALHENPGSADAYYWLGKAYAHEENYAMAWTAALTAQSLGYDVEDLVQELSLLSEKPEALWDSNGDGLLIRQIVVRTRDRAEDIVFGLSQGGRFERIVNDEMSEPGERLEYRDPSEMAPELADAARKLGVFADPVIVETPHGFHIVQRIPSIAVYTGETASSAIRNP